MNETQELSFEQIELQQSYQSNDQSEIPDKFLVITNLPILIYKFEQLEKRNVFNTLKMFFFRKSQNENFFDRFIQKRQKSVYYKRLMELKQESEVLNLKELQEKIESLINQYLKMGFEDEDAMKKIEDKLNRKSNQKKMQNFLRVSDIKKKKFNITRESNLSISQHNKNFEEDPEIEKSFFNRQDNLSQFQSLKFLASRNYGFNEDDVFSKTDQNYRKQFNEQVKQDLNQQKQNIQINNITQNIDNFQSNELQSNNESKNKRFDQIIEQINSNKIKLNPVNFAFKDENSMTDNQFNSDITNKGKDIQIKLPKDKQSDINSISEEQNQNNFQSSEDTFDKQFKIKIDYNKQDLKDEGMNSEDIKAVMDSLTLVNDMKKLKQNMKKLDEEEALLEKEMQEQDKFIQKYQKISDNIQKPFQDDNESIINDKGKKKNQIDSNIDDESHSEQISINIKSDDSDLNQQNKNDQNQENNNDQQILQIDIYDSNQNVTQFKIPQQKQQIIDDNSEDHIIIPISLLKKSQKKNHIWDKSSSESGNNMDNNNNEIRDKNFSIQPIKKLLNDKDTFTNSSASRYKRITQSQGKQKLLQQSQNKQLDNDLKISLDPLEIKSLKKFKSELQNNIKKSNENKVPKSYNNIYNNSNEDLNQLKEMSKKFNEVKEHVLEQTQKNDQQKQPQMFSFKQNSLSIPKQQQRMMIHQSNIENQQSERKQQYRTLTQQKIQKENEQNIKRHLTLIKNKLKSKQPSKKKLYEKSQKRNKTQIKKQTSINKKNKSKENEQKKFQSINYKAKEIGSLINKRQSGQGKSQNSIHKSQNSKLNQNSLELEELEDQNNIKKSGKQFEYLKRKKKTYSIHKVKWKVKSKVNCWNKPKQKSPKKIKMNHDINFDKVQAKVASLPKENKKSRKQSTISYFNILDTYENEFLPKYTEVQQNQKLKLENTSLPQIHLDDFQFKGDFYQIVLDDKKKYKKLLNFLEDQYEYILNNQIIQFYYLYQNLFLKI